jgi:hypothetical protein
MSIGTENKYLMFFFKKNCILLLLKNLLLYKINKKGCFIILRQSKLLFLKGLMLVYVFLHFIKRSYHKY